MDAACISKGIILPSLLIAGSDLHAAIRIF